MNSKFMSLIAASFFSIFCLAHIGYARSQKNESDQSYKQVYNTDKELWGLNLKFSQE